MSMRLGICPKCGSHEVYHDKGTYVSLVISLLRSAPLRQFICVQCGYLEQYVQHSKDGKLIKEKWIPVRDKRKRKNDEN